VQEEKTKEMNSKRYRRRDCSRGEGRIEVEMKRYEESNKSRRKTASGRKRGIRYGIRGLEFLSTELISQSEERKVEYAFRTNASLKRMPQRHLHELSLVQDIGTMHCNLVQTPTLLV
jgi:hypothetical protein